jgi:beta-mannosidase
MQQGENMRSGKLAMLLSALVICFGASLAAPQGQAKRVHEGRGASATSVDVPLDGNDWRMGSFDFEAGEKAGAATESFDESTFRTVIVPGDTQLQAGFTGVSGFRESKELMEVNAKEWWYRKHFRVGTRTAGTISRIVFDGVDYFATVWLNGRLLGAHEGTYTPFSFDVTGLLHYDGDNVLAVVVTHPWVPKGRALDEYIDGNFSMAQGKNLTNLPYHVGVTWDGLPAQGNATIPMGIWRGVHLRTSGPVTIGDVHVLTQSIELDGSAKLHVSVTLDNATEQTRKRKVELLLKPDNFSGVPQEIPALMISALPGHTTAEADVRVPNAQLWWSWDKGPQNLYDLRAVISPQDGLPGDERTVRLGIRTVTRDADMAYYLNGKKLFVKASWFSIETFYRSTATHEDYERDLRMFRDANYNLLVNFAVVEKPEFYDLCDELGILIVAELPFPQLGPQHVLDKDSPRREPFMKQARLQTAQIIIAERNHPSIVQWVPLAEAREKADQWFDGVDQQGYDMFVAKIKAIVTDLAPTTIFHPSLCDLGEHHFWIGAEWDPRHYQEQFDAQTKFVSEYGTTSISSFENLGKYLTPEEQWGTEGKNSRSWFDLPIDTTAYSYWTSNMSHGLYGVLSRTTRFVDAQPRSARELVQDTQLYQAFLLRYSAEAYRRKKYAPVNGIRNWNYQELAPGFRFAIVDYDRVPKIGYWYIKHALAPVAISFAYREVLESQLAGSEWSAPVWVINDLDREVHGTVHVELLTLSGQRVATADYPVAIAADGKAIAGTFSLTLPQAAGVYFLRASLPAEAAGGEPVEEISFIKVVPAAFQRSHRVLLIAQSNAAGPIAALLRSMGVTVDVYDQNATDAMSRDLTDSAVLHARYDAIWLGSFEFLAKVLPRESAKAIQEAVKAGSGFIVTGGEGSFHGGDGHAALVEATELNPVLPADTLGREDLIFGPHESGDTMQTRRPITAIAPADNASFAGFSAQSLQLLQHVGLVAFNQVAARPGSRTELSIAGKPLLITGTFGAGKTAAFTGFTPEESEQTKLPIDQYLMDQPQLRAYFALFVDLLADVFPGEQRRASGLLSAHEKPLFQTLKEQPQTEFALTKAEAPPGRSPGRCRIQIANRGGYAHLVHIRVEWPADGFKPFLTELSDNDFELLPNESREIEINWRTSITGEQASGTLIVDAANAPEVRLAF